MGSFPIPLGKSLESFAHDRNFGSHITFYHRYCQEKHFTVHSKVTKFSWLKLRSYNHLFVVTFEEFHLCKWFISDQNKCTNWTFIEMQKNGIFFSWAKILTNHCALWFWKENVGFKRCYFIEVQFNFPLWNIFWKVSSMLHIHYIFKENSNDIKEFFRPLETIDLLNTHCVVHIKQNITSVNSLNVLNDYIWINTEWFEMQ